MYLFKTSSFLPVTEVTEALGSSQSRDGGSVTPQVYPNSLPFHTPPGESFHVLDTFQERDCLVQRHRDQATLLFIFRPESRQGDCIKTHKLFRDNDDIFSN